MMSQGTNDAQAPATTDPKKGPVWSKPKKAAKKKVPEAKKKKAKKGKATKKAAKKPTPAEYGVDRGHDLPWNTKKVAIFRALKSLKALGAGNARDAVTVAEKADVTARDVRHYCYHAKAAGLVGIADVEGIRGYGFYLTAKGAKVDLKLASK